MDFWTNVNDYYFFFIFTSTGWDGFRDEYYRAFLVLFILQPVWGGMDFWTNINENYIFFSFILQPVWGGKDFWTNINEKYFFSSFILQPVWGGMDFWTNIKGFFFPLHVFAQLVFISLIAFPMTGSRKWIAVCTYTHCWVFIFFTYTPDVYYSDPEHKQHLVSDMHIKRSLYARPCHVTGASNLFSTAVPIWGQTTQIPSGLSQKRDCSSKWVNV